MSVFNYLFHTSWTTKKEDWEKYWSLRRDVCKALRHQEGARDSIVANILSSDVFMPYGAYPVKCATECTTYIQNADNTVQTYSNWRCANFHKDKVCICSECPLAVRQADYVNARQRVIDARQMRKQFWREAIKQKTKVIEK